MSDRLNRRSFVKKAGSTALGATVLSVAHPALTSAPETQPAFQSAWSHDVDRPWPGPDYWPNPLQDWRVRAGRLECGAFEPSERRPQLIVRSTIHPPANRAQETVQREGDAAVGRLIRILKAAAEFDVNVLIEGAGQPITGTR